MTASHPVPREVDALVIGAGPVGLWQVFQLGLLGLRCSVVDALPCPGGQCHALYGDKPIYDLPGIPACTAQELVDRLLLQVQPFAPVFHAGLEVSHFHTGVDGRHTLVAEPLPGSAEPAQAWITHNVFIAAGVGAFQPRRLHLPGAQGLEGLSIHYHPVADVAQVRDGAGQDWIVLGGDDRALDWAADMAARVAVGHIDAPRRVTLLYRRDRYAAEAPRVARIEALAAAGALHQCVGQPEALQTNADGGLHALHIIDTDGQAHALPARHIAVSLGLSPRLGPIADWGLPLAHKQLHVDPAAGYTTPIAGVHAVGDVAHYPGKKKLLVCGFHEATLAAHATFERLHPKQPHPLQYTSSSRLLQDRLGVLPSEP